MRLAFESLACLAVMGGLALSVHFWGVDNRLRPAPTPTETFTPFAEMEVDG